MDLEWQSTLCNCCSCFGKCLVRVARCCQADRRKALRCTGGSHLQRLHTERRKPARTPLLTQYRSWTLGWRSRGNLGSRLRKSHALSSRERGRRTCTWRHTRGCARTFLQTHAHMSCLCCWCQCIRCNDGSRWCMRKPLPRDSSCQGSRCRQTLKRKPLV